MHPWYRQPHAASYAADPYITAPLDDDRSLGDALVAVLDPSLRDLPPAARPVDEAYASLSGLPIRRFWLAAHCCEIRVRDGKFVVLPMKHIGRPADALRDTGETVEIPLDSALGAKIEAVRQGVRMATEQDARGRAKR
jgi:hypothetical protein